MNESESKYDRIISWNNGEYIFNNLGCSVYIVSVTPHPKVLHSLHNNTQQPVIYLVEGKSVVAPVALIWEKTAKAGLSLITRTTPTKQHTCLQFSVAK